MKKLLEPIRITLIVLLILAEVIFFSWLKSIHIDYIKMKDYPAIYKEQLDIIFGGDYEIGPRQTISGIVSDEAGEKFYRFYYKWKITYRDSLADEHTMQLTNRYSFEGQIFDQLQTHANDYFEKILKKSDYGEYIDDNILFSLFSIYSVTPELREAEDVIQKYWWSIERSFKDPGNLPHLYDISYGDWFVTYPGYSHIYLHESAVYSGAVQGILDILSEETAGKFNLELVIMPDQNSDEKNNYEFLYYIFGEPVELSDYHDYELTLFYEYEKSGMFD